MTTIKPWLAWIGIRIAMLLATVRLWLRGMPWAQARRTIAQETKLYLHKHVCKQFGGEG
jgi:hypothetical protein